MPPHDIPIDLKGSIDYATLQDRNVLVTGGASGLAKDFVRMFAECGANIVVADVQEEAGLDLVGELSEKGVKYCSRLTLSAKGMY